jgi:hypothetical protein
MLDKSVKSWATPLFFSGLAWLAVWYAVDWVGSQVWILAIVFLGTVLLAVAIANLWEYVRERNQQGFEFRQSTLTRTSDARLFEEARLLAAQSPELAGELAKRVGRPDLILFQNRQGRRAQIKLAGSDVTLQFALDVLGRSDDVHMAAQRNYQDSTYLFDPNREMPDRKQWVQLNWILSREGLVTRYVPNQATNTPPLWLPPWTPARIRENWLLPGDLLEILKPYLVDEKDESL